MKQTKIDWCDRTINPVIGCKRGCPYCYARKINERFGFVKDFSVPTTMPGALCPVFPKRNVSIFFDSMSDFGFWTPDQVIAMKRMILQSGWCAYWVGLTKSPECLNEFRDAGGMKDSFRQIDGSVWLGYSCGDLALVEKALRMGKEIEADFLSIEPLEEDIGSSPAFWELVSRCKDLKAVIIGSETGNRKGKVACEKEWVQKIVQGLDWRCRWDGLAIFMKSSLKETMGPLFRQDILPWPLSKGNGGGSEAERKAGE